MFRQTGEVTAIKRQKSKDLPVASCRYSHSSIAEMWFLDSDCQNILLDYVHCLYSDLDQSKMNL